jgi:ferredoxin
METVTSKAVQVVEDLLSQCETLQVCVICHDKLDKGAVPERHSALDTLSLIKDPRLVFIIKPKDVTWTGVVL